MYYTAVLLWIKTLNSLIYRTPFYINIYGSFKLLKTVPFLAHPVVCVNSILTLNQLWPVKVVSDWEDLS